MKTLLLVIAFLGANMVTPPEAVLKAFQSKFPNATKVHWDKENKKEYEAGFVSDKVKMSANFSITGEWLETEMPIRFNALPDKVMTAFRSKYPKTIPTEVARIEKSNGYPLFELEVKNGLKTKDLIYDENGNLTK